jgi:hypothetical protein
MAVASRDSMSLGRFRFLPRAETGLTVFVTCLICPPVGTPAKMSARVRLDTVWFPRDPVVFSWITRRGVWNPACQPSLLMCRSAR